MYPYTRVQKGQAFLILSGNLEVPLGVICTSSSLKDLQHSVERALMLAYKIGREEKAREIRECLQSE